MSLTLKDLRVATAKTSFPELGYRYRPASLADLVEVLQADPDTLVISKVNGEWPDEIVLSVRHEGDRRTLVALLDALLEGQPKWSA